MTDFSEFFDAMEKLQEIETNFIGDIGESAFTQFAFQHLDDSYFLCSDIVLKTQTGTTQIDQIIISRFGIFVVEIKNYKGWIFGNAKAAQWTQVLTSGKYRFQNPLRQNYKHIKTLQSLFNYREDTFKSLVVFSGQVGFKTEVPENVVRGGAAYINFIKKHQTVLLSDDAVKKSFEHIENNRLSNEEHQAHIAKIKEQYSNADENNAPQCPRCTNIMILRIAKSGQNIGNKFWGCSRYPQCKFTISISNDNEKITEQIRKMEKALRFIGL
jgi:hypothetical protein